MVSLQRLLVLFEIEDEINTLQLVLSIGVKLVGPERWWMEGSDRADKQNRQVGRVRY
jgi:hypothetical protein